MSVSSRSTPSTASLASKLRRKVEDWPGISVKTMFGRESFLADDTLFAFVDGNDLVLTELSAETRHALAQGSDARPFRAGTRVVYNWLSIPANPRDFDAVVEPLTESYEAACRLARTRKRRPQG